MVGRSRFECLLHFPGHVLDEDKLVNVEVGDLSLLGQAGREESGFVKILSRLVHCIK